MLMMPMRLLLIIAFLVAAPAHAQNAILVQESPLAGFQFHHGKKLWDELKVGDALTLAREPADRKSVV